MRVTYLITAEDNSDFANELDKLLAGYSEAWRTKEGRSQSGLNWWGVDCGHPAESAETMTKELRLACIKHSSGEVASKEVAS